MKKKILTVIITALFLTFLASCDRDDLFGSSKSYRIINDFEAQYTPSNPYLDGSLYEVIVFQLNHREDVIKKDYISVIPSGGLASRVIAVPNECEFIQVSFLYLPANKGGLLNFRNFTAQYFYILEDITSDIVIDLSTILTRAMSMASARGDTTVGRSINLVPSL